MGTWRVAGFAVIFLIMLLSGGNRHFFGVLAEDTPTQEPASAAVKKADPPKYEEKKEEKEHAEKLKEEKLKEEKKEEKKETEKPKQESPKEEKKKEVAKPKEEKPKEEKNAKVPAAGKEKKPPAEPEVAVTDKKKPADKADETKKKRPKAETDTAAAKKPKPTKPPKPFTESSPAQPKVEKAAAKRDAAKGAASPTRCIWTKQENMFIGEFASGLSRTYELATAKRVCENLKDLCKGVTCTTAIAGTADCTVRKGVPPLGPSPAGELSFTKTCGEDAVTTTLDPSQLDLVQEMEAENIVLPDMTLTFPLSARQEEIFFEEIDKEGILIQGGFFAAADGDTEESGVDFTILDPNKQLIHTKRAAEGLFHFHTGKVGTYQFKVTNGHMMSKVWVTFSFGKATGQGVEQKELNSVETTCNGLDPLLKGIQNENSYLWIRQKTQLNSMAQAKQHTLFFTMVEFGVLIIVSVAQVYYMKSLFSYRRVL